MATFTILEPMSTGDVIDRAVRLYRRNFSHLIAIVAVPSIIGYLVGLALSSGYAQLLGSVVNPGAGVQGAGVILVIIGLIGYPLWFFAQVFTLTGLARVVGDHLMMGDTITFRKCFAAARSRVGDVILMTLLLFAAMMVIGMAFFLIVFSLMMVAAIIVGISSGAGMPQWLAVTVMVILMVVALAGGITLALIVAARIVLLPQVVMIEGQSTGSSLGRSIRLGGGNWHRVGAIMLFAYFISLSLLAALTLPVALGLEWFNISSVEFAQTPAGDAIYSAFTQIANVLSLPIWAVSFTLLYLDNRVRKEGYDMELLAQEVAPGFHWHAPVQPSVYPYGTFAAAPAQRVYVQTGPLGLGGYTAPPISSPNTPNPPSNSSDEPPKEAESAGEAAVVDSETIGNVAPGAAQCANCGVELPPGSRFCIRCGAETRPEDR
jgi:hypothetical protein